MAGSPVTDLLAERGAEAGQRVDELVALVYDELRRMAHRQLSREVGPRTLNTTGLVHEAYLKLVDEDAVPLRNRRYFFGAAARAMRQVLIDAARRRKRVRRGGGERPLPLDESQIAVDAYAAELVELDDALTRLAGEHARPARVVECRFFGGLSVEETAELLEVSPMTVKRDWTLARTWLYRDLSAGSPGTRGPERG
jgi:RNA polymerase sigma factor (TIGR02999 family)